MINTVVLVGRIGNDPEMRYTPSGMPVVNFRLGVTRVRRGDTGEDQTDWFDIVCFQKTAEFVSQYLDKGALVGVEGRLQSRTWEGADGRKNYRVEIIANNVQSLESRQEAERRRAARGQAAPTPSAAPDIVPEPDFEPELPPDDFETANEMEDPFGDQ